MNLTSQTQGRPPRDVQRWALCTRGWEMVLRLSPWRRLLIPVPAHLSYQLLLPSQGCEASLASIDGYPESRWTHDQQMLCLPRLGSQGWAGEYC